MVTDHRLHPRLLVRIPGEYRVEGSSTWHRATIHDLSAGGATLLTMDRLPPKTVVRLRFSLPGEGSRLPHPIEIETLVLRTDAHTSSAGNVLYRQALHFLDLQGEPFERVRHYVFDRREGATT